MEALRGIGNSLHEFRDHQEQVSEELQTLAEGHVEQSAELTLLPIAPKDYHAQRFDRLWVNGNPKDPETIELVATQIEPRFPEMLQALDEAEAKSREITRLGEDLKAGDNIMLVTNHGDIKDIAYCLAAVCDRLKLHGYEGFESSLIMSKMIAHLGVDLRGNGLDDASLAAIAESLGLPMKGTVSAAVDVLKLVCDKEYFSFPRTDSIRNSRIASGYVSAYNRALKAKIASRLKQGSQLFAVAPSGTRDKPLPDAPDTIRLAPAGQGTVELLKGDHTKIVPVAIWLKGEKIVFSLCDVPRAVTKDEDVHEAMEKIAAFLDRQELGKNFVYSPAYREVGQTALREP